MSNQAKKKTRKPGTERPRPVQAPKRRTDAAVGRSRWLLWGAVGGVIVLAVVLAVVFTRGGDDTEAPQSAAIAVDGKPLPADTDAAADPAVGSPAPAIMGTTLDGSTSTIPSGAGDPHVVLFLAHWCPHCQAEVPRIVDWIRETGGVDGVPIYSVATANDPARPNYPAAAWLERESWPFPAIVDDGSNTAAAAYGLSGYPFFVFVDGEGNVVSRESGELPVDELASRMTAMAEAENTG
jgi:thiol-disulfide isomerase/thioredoxin